MGKKPAVHTAVSGKCWQLCCKTGSFLTFSSLPCLAPCSHSPRGLCLLWKKQHVGWSSTRRLQRADSTARGSCTGSSATALLSRIELAAEPTELGKRAKPNSYTGIFHLGCYLPHRLIFIFSKLYCALLFILKSNQSTSISMHLLAIPRFYKSLLVKKKKKRTSFFWTGILSTLSNSPFSRIQPTLLFHIQILYQSRLQTTKTPVHRCHTSLITKIAMRSQGKFNLY